ncbi:hypothetical protein EMCRGX_G002730 [Ephydatia muelleri]
MSEPVRLLITGYDCALVDPPNIMEWECPVYSSCVNLAYYNSTYDDVVSAHHLVCPSVRVPCPNGCNAVLERQHLKQHIDNGCPNSLVECDFSGCGCRVKTTRRELPAHLNTDLPFHMSMLSKSHAQLLLEVQQLKSKNNAMMSYLKTSLSLAQDVRISAEIGYQKPLVPGKLLQKNFYSDIGGYKMQLQILCSTSDHLSKYVRLYPRVYLMKGEFDKFLSWPFEGEKCKTRVLNEKGIAEEGVGSAADIIVDVERFREGNRDYRALFKVENVKECTNNWMLKQLRQRRTLVYT